MGTLRGQIVPRGGKGAATTSHPAFPYRFIVVPIVQFILELSKTHPSRRIAVVIPELVEDRWYEYFLHNQRARLLEWVLLTRGNEHVFIVNSPWYIRERPKPQEH